VHSPHEGLFMYDHLGSQSVSIAWIINPCHKMGGKQFSKKMHLSKEQA